MKPTNFSEKTNFIANQITALTPDVGERLGLAAAIYELFRYDLSRALTSVDTNPGPNSHPIENTEVKPAEEYVEGPIDSSGSAE